MGTIKKGRNDSKVIMVLMKMFSKKEYAEEFMRGKLHFTDIDKFIEAENSERKDKYENSDIILNEF